MLGQYIGEETGRKRKKKEKEDDEHTAESVGSNSSQNQSIKKHTAGKRKRETENLPQPFMSNSRNQNGRSLPPFGNFISYIHSRKHEVYAPATTLGPGYNSPKVMPEFRTEVNPQPSEVPSLEELFRAPRVLAESDGDWVISMMNHYDFPSDIKSMLAAKLLDNPSMFPLMVGFDEKTLLSFIRAVSHKGLFDTWYMEWTARN